METDGKRCYQEVSQALNDDYVKQELGTFPHPSTNRQR